MPGAKIEPLLSATSHHRDGGACVYCGRKPTDEVPFILSVDHLVTRV